MSDSFKKPYHEFCRLIHAWCAPNFAAPVVTNEKKVKVSAKAISVFLFLIVGMVGSFFAWKEAQYYPSKISEILQSHSSLSRHEKNARFDAMNYALEITTLPRCRSDDWKDECFGFKKYDSGAWYIGEFRLNERHGHGVYLWPEGNFHEGNWVDNHQSGYGTKYRTDGTRRECYWVPNTTDYTASCGKGPGQI